MFTSPFLMSMPTGWHVFTRLGEAQILLPAMLAALLWLALSARDRRSAWRWSLATFVVALITTVTKVAFFGFEVGYAPLDYTGISGHAMFAAAVLPVLCAVAACGTRWRNAAVAFGYALAVLVAYSRVPVGAHSPFEALVGLLLGSLASALVLRFTRLPAQRAPLWLGVALALWILSLPLSAPPSFTHGMVVKLSLAVSGRTVPYSRWRMHRDWRVQQQQRKLQAQQLAGTAPPSAAH